MKTLSIVIPVYNEERTISEVLRRVAGQNIGDWRKEIIVVDDGSTDNSKRKIQENQGFSWGSPEPEASGRWQNYNSKTQNLKMLEHGKNLGKGAAIRTALAEATGDYVLIQDADLEYDPADWPVLLQAAEAHPGAAIYGSRNLNPGRQGYRHFVWGVWFLTGVANLLFRARLTDIYTGYKLIPRMVFTSLPFISSGFEFEAEVTTRLLKRGVEIKEVPIHYYPRKFREGKKIRWQDGLKGLLTIIKVRVTRG